MNFPKNFFPKNFELFQLFYLFFPIYIRKDKIILYKKKKEYAKIIP